MAVIDTRTQFQGRIITVNVETVTLPNGHVAELEIVHHPGGAAAVALDDAGRVCLIRQYRHAAGGYIVELPAGKLEPGEPPQRTAERELSEEAGLSAQIWHPLGSYVSSPGVFTERIHLFMAECLAAATMEREAAEVIEVVWMDFATACQQAESGAISDGKTALGLLRARALLAGKGQAEKQ